MREFSPCSCLIALPCPAWVLLSKICIPFCRSLYSVPNSSGYDRFITAKSTRPIAIGNISKSSHYSNERRQVWSECPIWLSDVKRYHLSLPRIAHCRPLCCPDTLRYERETEGGAWHLSFVGSGADGRPLRQCGSLVTFFMGISVTLMLCIV